MAKKRRKSRKSKNRSKKPSKKSRKKLIGCSYHLCNKKGRNFKKCKYCGEYFCKEHIKAKPPVMPRFKSSSKEDHRSMEEYRRPGGHPCSPYSQYWRAKHEKGEWERNRKYDKFLDSLKKQKTTETQRDVYQKKIKKTSSLRDKIDNFWYWNKKIILAIIVMLILAYLLYIGFKSGELYVLVNSIFSGFTAITGNFLGITSNFVSNFSSTISETLSVPVSDVEMKIFEYTNEERVKNGLRPLSWDSKLADIARAHSNDMAKNNFFSHTNQLGQDPTDRAIASGYSVRKNLAGGWYLEGIGENIGSMPTGNILGGGYIAPNADSIGKAHMDSWMKSQGHRENILNKQYTHIGVGVAFDGTYYIATQNFW